MSDIIFKLISKEKRRQKTGIELIASENFVSPHVLKAMGSCLTNKYAEGYPGKRYYGGCEVVDQIETLAIERAKLLFGAQYANVQPHSGAQANSSIFISILQPGDCILGFDLSHGGHLTHGSKVNMSGKLYNPVFYGVNKESGRIDMDEVKEIAFKHQPKLIICGASAYSRDWEYDKFRAIADQVGAILMADIAHPAGLIAAKLLNDPMQHCHIVTTTTHKTLRGPRGGLIMMGNDYENPWGRTTKKGNPLKMSSIINSGVFPGMQGGPLEHVIAAKAVAFEEASSHDFVNYCQNVINNAQVFASELMDRGYHICSKGTDNHMMLIDLRSKSINGKEAEAALQAVDITVNKNMVPFDDKSPFITSGVRIGTAAITTRGMKIDDCKNIVELFDAALSYRGKSKIVKDLRKKVRNLTRPFPLFQ